MNAIFLHFRYDRNAVFKIIKNCWYYVIYNTVNHSFFWITYSTSAPYRWSPLAATSINMQIGNSRICIVPFQLNFKFLLAKRQTWGTRVSAELSKPKAVFNFSRIQFIVNSLDGALFFFCLHENTLRRPNWSSIVEPDKGNEAISIVCTREGHGPWRN